MSRRTAWCRLAVWTALALAASTAAAQLTPMEQLGKNLYFDTNLSSPNKMACATCHAPAAGWADPDFALPTSLGVIDERYGNRNSPSSAYAAMIPPFGYDEAAGVYFGGQFWDGRAMTLEDQAKGPFLNPLEMANPNPTAVVTDVLVSAYGDLFRRLIGKTNAQIMADVPAAYDFIASAIATYERSAELNRFDSKYDLYLAGQAELTELELQGSVLFEGKAGCAACHPIRPAADGTPPAMSTFVYHNLGVPGNPANLFLAVPTAFNPDGAAYVDYGLGGRLGEAAQLGKFRTMTLRNIAATPPYMHNGVLPTLEAVVDFMNSRDLGGWPPAEVADNVTAAIGDLGLSLPERQALVAFLETFTDGPAAKAGSPIVPLAAGGVAVLEGNSPNPFNPATRIAYYAAADARVRLTVHDVRGRVVAVLVEGEVDAGRHVITWDAADVPSGVYFCRLEAGGAASTRKMILLK